MRLFLFFIFSLFNFLLRRSGVWLSFSTRGLRKDNGFMGFHGFRLDVLVFGGHKEHVRCIFVFTQNGISLCFHCSAYILFMGSGSPK